MAPPLKRGEKVLYTSASLAGEVPGRVTEDEVNGTVLLDIRSRHVQATSVKRQRRESAAARPVAPAATALPEPAGAAETLQPKEQSPKDSKEQSPKDPKEQSPQDPGQSSRAAPRGAARQPGEPDQAVADAIVTWMGGVRNCRGLVDNLQAVYPDKTAAVNLRNALLHTFSKKPRAGVSWSNFDAAPKSSGPVAVAGSSGRRPM